jgi:hypothetical protein
MFFDQRYPLDHSVASFIGSSKTTLNSCNSMVHVVTALQLGIDGSSSFLTEKYERWAHSHGGIGSLASLLSDGR